jgi:hypothetical protein
VQLDDAERQWLAFRPYGANEVPAELSCELEAGHPYPHAACGQVGNGIGWWKHWTLRAGEILQHRPCGAEIPNPNPDDTLNDTQGVPALRRAPRPAQLPHRPVAPAARSISHTHQDDE